MLLEIEGVMDGMTELIPCCYEAGGVDRPENGTEGRQEPSKPPITFFTAQLLRICSQIRLVFVVRLV